MLTDQLDAVLLRSRLVAPNGPYAAVDVVGSTGSTNTDLARAAAAGAADRTVLLAEQQTAGQGRHARGWVSPPGVGLYLSVLLRPSEVPAARLGWVTLLAGVALVRAVRRTAGVDAVLKWPNDLLAGPGRGKCAGVLATVVAPPSPAVVVGIGLNVGRLPQDVPAGVGGLPATSLAEAGAASTDRGELAVALLRELAALDAEWRHVHGDPASCALLTAYRDHCSTLGQQVRVELPGGQQLRGTAVDLDREGRLVVRTAAGAEQAVSAGDVVHLRPLPGPEVSPTETAETNGLGQR